MSWRECCRELFDQLIKSDDELIEEHSHPSPVMQHRRNSIPVAIEPLFAGQWVKFVNVQYDHTTCTQEWIGEILVVLPTMERTGDENPRIMLYSSCPHLGLETPCKFDNMLRVRQWSSISIFHSLNCFTSKSRQGRERSRQPHCRTASFGPDGDDLGSVQRQLGGMQSRRCY
ncbi:hypothetical protein BDV24DRAFT_145132 [Aspergillus arachidicola]|uniref:Uncharacterized protein n=1 Tax=Aspergillus arachidicola TaxID=656916 RepID=A0A5N6XNJ4_9EURO|nr:hypothetical protein BDV24DRAFT_145132 [Aspergillus arachidicola]